jgi:hypothetical protein
MIVIIHAMNIARFRPTALVTWPKKKSAIQLPPQTEEEFSASVAVFREK